MVENKTPPKQKWERLTENLMFVVNGGKNVMFKIDGSKVLRPSKSGKTDIIATSGRPKEVQIGDSTVFVNLTVYKYRD